MIVLADCNNFFVSCEKVFNPSLEGLPVIVLSNNDGCVVSRSNEAKAIGIKMGDPYFQIKDFCIRHNVAVFSSNFQLYRDLSNRVMSVLSSIGADIEIYSVDEAFLLIEPEEIYQKCIGLRKKVKQWVGIPISLGIAQTKTLAKVASSVAKKSDSGVFDISNPEIQKEILQKYPIGDVWGIGARLSQALKSMGVRTALEFRNMDPPIVRKKMGVVGERMLWELRGLSCNHLEGPRPKKSITVSRSFGKVIEKEAELAEALSTFVSSASEKLRLQKSTASGISIFLGDGLNLYEEKEILDRSTSDTSEIITIAKKLLSKIFIVNIRYKKCGVVLFDISPESVVSNDLFLPKENPKRKALMKTVDLLNERFGKNSLFFGAMGTKPKWNSRKNELSDHNTIEWDHLPIVKA